VLGAYILLYPNRSVRAFVFNILTTVPAWVAVGLWFAFQLVSGLGILGRGSQEGGVAYAAHVGGFIAGLVLVKFFAIGRNTAAGAPRAY
jgi:membrane associated rhomboid family serine protease